MRLSVIGEKSPVNDVRKGKERLESGKPVTKRALASRRGEPAAEISTEICNVNNVKHQFSTSLPVR
jgi:hypothetical protein